MPNVGFRAGSNTNIKISIKHKMRFVFNDLIAEVISASFLANFSAASSCFKISSSEVTNSTEFTCGIESLRSASLVQLVSNNFELQCET